MASLPFELKGKTVYVAGHRGMVGSALVRRLARGERRTADGDAQRGRSARSGRGQPVVRRQAPAGGVSGGGQGRRHRRQQHAARRIPLRQSGDCDECDPCGACQWRREADVPRLVLHLSEAGAAAVARGLHADGAAGADQRALCDCQDRRDQDGGGLSQPVRRRLHQRDADQSLRQRRQLSSRIQPRRRRPDPPLPRSEDFRRRQRSWSGAPARRGANSSMSTISRTPASI